MSPNLARRLLCLPLVGLAVLALASCAQPLESPGKTGQIQFVATSTSGGWKFDHYRNLAYPCSINGYQTFVIGTKVGSSDTATAPLWVRMRGGGVGWFDTDGNPRPSAGVKSEETAATSIRFISDNALTGRVRADAAGFRFVSVSMCNHDIYAGGDQPDPYNPNTTPDGKPRTVNGMMATKAAIAYAKQNYPTGKVSCTARAPARRGCSTWPGASRRRALRPPPRSRTRARSNTLWERASTEQGVCEDGGRSEGALGLIAVRLHPALRRPANEPDLLVARGDLAVPILHTWSRNDRNVCGATPMTCPLRDGSTVTLGSADCAHEPMRRAIASLGGGSKSLNLRLCVSPVNEPGTCLTHVVTSSEQPNTDPAEPADYLTKIMAWVHARLAD